ncbi:hypothetical protein C8J56DRAFT_888875 [Mycena floridula]|nr:hypothetical protein C8J56DRAFT_888875 [Mycena floridula]
MPQRNFHSKTKTMNPLTIQNYGGPPLPHIHPGPGGLALRALQLEIELCIQHAQRYSAKFEEQLRSQTASWQTQVGALEIELESLHAIIRAGDTNAKLDEALDTLNYLCTSQGHLEAENQQIKAEKYRAELELEKKKLELHEMEMAFAQRLKNQHQELAEEFEKKLMAVWDGATISQQESLEDLIKEASDTEM